MSNKPNQKEKPDWKEQEEAFLGSSSHVKNRNNATNTVTRNNNYNTWNNNSNSNYSMYASNDEPSNNCYDEDADAALARELQKLYEKEIETEQSDLEFAKRLQESENQSQSQQQQQSGTNIDQTEIETEQSDWEFAKRLQESENESQSQQQLHIDHRDSGIPPDNSTTRSTAATTGVSSSSAAHRGHGLHPGNRRTNNSNNYEGDYSSTARHNTIDINHTPTKNDNSTTNSTMPICAICNKFALYYISTLGHKYHPKCFKCMGCHGTIQPNESFRYTTSPDNNMIKLPLHNSCYVELFGAKCTVCDDTIPTDDYGNISYAKHPFFDTEKMCVRHSSEAIRRCTGCHRFEPNRSNFADLGDGNRCVCMSCCRTVIVDSSDAKPLWDNVIRFFEQYLKLPIWAEMRDIPVLIVGYQALNEQLSSSNSNSAHSNSSQIMTRGLCLSEHNSTAFDIFRMKFDSKQRIFKPADDASTGHTFFQIPDATESNPNSNVTAILCLSGLPADLTSSILAHEATHAWFKLNPNFDVTKPIPRQVEEGCCQLIAMLFLNDGLPPTSSSSSTSSNAKNADTHGPSDEKLRQYFKFSIETDENETYGQGYRKAAKAYASLGIEALMSHVINYREFPTV